MDAYDSRVDTFIVSGGPKFLALAEERKEAALNVSAAQVFKLPEDGTLGPDQKLVVVDGTGKQVATFGADGLKLVPQSV